MQCTFQVSRVLQRLPLQQRPLATQEGRARHSRAQHEAAGEENQEAKTTSGHRFSAIEWAFQSFSRVHVQVKPLPL